MSEKNISLRRWVERDDLEKGHLKIITERDLPKGSLVQIELKIIEQLQAENERLKKITDRVYGLKQASGRLFCWVHGCKKEGTHREFEELSDTGSMKWCGYCDFHYAEKINREKAKDE